MPIFDEVLRAPDWRERERHLSSAYLIMADLHNALHVTPSIAGEITPFFDRPYLVPHAGRFVDALRAAIDSKLPFPKNVGGINQFIDNTDVLDDIGRCRTLASIYGELNSSAGTSVAHEKINGSAP